MAAINGTTVILNCDAEPIAMQKGLSLSVDCNLPDGSSKDSQAWSECFAGLMNVTIDFDALYSTGLLTDDPAVLSAKDLLDYIINRGSITVRILGIGNGYEASADMSSLKFGAPAEEAMSLSGSLKINGVFQEVGT